MARSERSALEGRIRHEMCRLRKRVGGGDDSQLLYWAMPGRLACAQRPLRDHPLFGRRGCLPTAARPLVISWVERLEHEGVKSIICLLVPKQLALYDGLYLHADGLSGYYESQGFQVRHLHLTDYQPPSEAQMEQALEAFDELPKPVLVHCSAGIDRTPPIAAYIVSLRGM